MLINVYVIRYDGFEKPNEVQNHQSHGGMYNSMTVETTSLYVIHLEATKP